jgi:CBS-domain-containing membrane protein
MAEGPAGASGLRTVVGVRANVPWSSAAPLASAPPWQVPIVDGVDRFIGFVSSQDLASRVWPWRVLRLVPAGELSYGRFLAAPVSLPLDAALRLMAHHGARAVALVDDEGLLKGVLSDIDALRGLKR